MIKQSIFNPDVPFWHFWNPSSGIVGGIIAALVVMIFLAFAFAIGATLGHFCPLT